MYLHFCTDSQKLYEQGTLKSSLARLFAIVYTSLRRKFPLESVILSRLHRCAVLSADNSKLFCSRKWRFRHHHPGQTEKRQRHWYRCLFSVQKNQWRFTTDGFHHISSGWGWGIRTPECWDQNPVPYHLANPQYTNSKCQMKYDEHFRL